MSFILGTLRQEEPIKCNKSLTFIDINSCVNPKDGIFLHVALFYRFFRSNVELNLPTLFNGFTALQQPLEYFSAVADASAQHTKIYKCSPKKRLFFTVQKQHVSVAFSLTTEVCVVDCGPHGSCISGVCQCEEGWTGPECEQRDCHPRCIDHGVCREGKCDCHQGWTGEHCTIGEPPWHTSLHTYAHLTEGHELPRKLVYGLT